MASKTLNGTTGWCTVISPKHEDFEALLKKYEGGQLEWQNPDEGWLYRGQIASITVEKNPRPDDVWFNYKMTVTFEWVAELDKRKAEWYEMPDKSVTVDTMLYSFNMLGQDRLGMASAIHQELAVFFPPGGSKLAKERVLPREDKDAKKEAHPGGTESVEGEYGDSEA